MPFNFINTYTQNIQEFRYNFVMYSAGRCTPMAYRDANDDNDDASSNFLQGQLCAVVAHSHVLDSALEPKAELAETDNSVYTHEVPSHSSHSSHLLRLDIGLPNVDNMLPPYDALVALPPAVQCRKFFTDLRPLDRILARIVRPGVAVLHVELVCMFSRFRRTLLAFMKGRLVPVPFDRTKRFYNINDYISTTVVSIAPASEELELEIDENEAILTQQGIPAYCRDFGRTTFDDSDHIQSLRDNPNLSAQLGVPLACARSGILSLCAKLGGGGGHADDNSTASAPPTAQQLRAEQTAKLAMAHVRRGAELTRQNKCFEAIQCFNKALNVDEHCADAFVGRGAACAGCRNFPAALADLERAVQLQPNHRNATKYRVEVLYTYAKELEQEGKLEDARAKFGQLLELCPDHAGALDGMARLRKCSSVAAAAARDDDIVELIELNNDDTDQDEESSEDGYGGNDDGQHHDQQQHIDRCKRRMRSGGESVNGRESGGGNKRAPQNGCTTRTTTAPATTRGEEERRRRRETMTEEEARRNRQKLAEMEAFIAKLKGGPAVGGSGKR